MKQKNLYIMCGIPGAGKTSWLAKQGDIYVISRDDVRNVMMDGNHTPSREEEVFKTYVKYIQESIDNEDTPEDIYCDATHITKGSRDKLLNALNLENVKNITVLVVRPSLEECLARNESRRNTTAYVPRGQIRRMYFQFQRPEEDEDRIFDVKYVEVPKEWEKFG